MCMYKYNILCNMHITLTEICHILFLNDVSCNLIQSQILFINILDNILSSLSHLIQDYEALRLETWMPPDLHRLNFPELSSV